MEWIIGLILVIAIPIWIIIYWIPYCDKKGIEKAKNSISTMQREIK
jgi:hypothetical protein